ncbi:heat shock 70 kDa protein 16-like [Iris pallida]|uniref:Heat shock 70 kDa protein 16-like n=1 Tax=Iris pallida TaxID=29817 RepID=A0AAX6EMW5_IRIPA|nr:heat shock 70 kDa protein 16-like [Iris pallida]
MSVVGFDIGNDTSVVAAVKHRGIDVLLNHESNRETPSAVSFSPKQRLFGSPAASAAVSNPRSTVSSSLKLLLLSPSAAPIIHFPHGSSRSFTRTHLLAMLLSHLKTDVAAKNLDLPPAGVSDCVIGVPSYATDLHRRSYLHAAQIAGLNPLRLLHDGTATALGYGIYKTDFPGGASVVVFVDVGHCDTQISVVSFEPGQMRVLSHASDANLGGRDFDEVLFNHFAEEFKEKYRIDVHSNLRAGVRLRSACEKLKKVLSANAEAPIAIECLMEEKDVRGFIKREEFERLSAELLERVLVPCKKAMSDAGLGVEKVHAVELVGSGSRIPAIMRVLSGFFRREPGRTINASECVARGCALQCAMLSPVFRVRDYEVQDTLPFSIGFSTDEGPISTLSSNILFRKGTPFPSVKVLTFHRTHTFHLEAFYADPSELAPGTPPKIGCFTIGPFQVPQNEKSKVKVKIRVNLHGIVSVESASLIEDDFNRDPESPSDAQMDAAAHTAENSTFSQSESAEGARTERPCGRHELPVTENMYGAMTKDDILQAQELEQQLAYQDKLMEQTKDKKNALEAFVYEVRNKLFERYRSFASESEKEGITMNLQETEEWLYDDGDDETEMVYTSKLEDLKKLVDPIENRYRDEEARAQATRELLKCIVDHRMAVQAVATYERDAVNNECNKAEQWLREKSQQQDSLPKNTDPVLWSHEIKKRTEALNTTCRNILRHKGSPSRPEDTRGSDHSNNPDNMQTD